MVCDFGRPCFQRVAWFFSVPPPIPGAALPCNYARGLYYAKKRETWIRWYEAPPGALPMPFAAWCSSEWDDPFQKDLIEYGEAPAYGKTGKFQGDAPPTFTRVYTKGVTPPGVGGTFFCGKESDFQVPKVWSPSLPSLKRGPDNIPLCCRPALRYSRVLQVVLPSVAGLGLGARGVAPGGVGLGSIRSVVEGLGLGSPAVVAAGLGLGGVEAVIEGLGLGGEEIVAAGLGLGGRLPVVAGLGLRQSLVIAPGLGLGGEAPDLHGLGLSFTVIVAPALGL